jgi:hypothetical protein
MSPNPMVANNATCNHECEFQHEHALLLVLSSLVLADQDFAEFRRDVENRQCNDPLQFVSDQPPEVAFFVFVKTVGGGLQPRHRLLE